MNDLDDDLDIEIYIIPNSIKNKLGIGKLLYKTEFINTRKPN